MDKTSNSRLTATAFFRNDPSVGIREEWFEMELSFEDKGHRERTRGDVEKFYTDLQNDFLCICTWVRFSDESDAD